MTIAEAIAVDTLLRALTNEDGTSWEDMEREGAFLADRAHRVLMAGHNARSFRAALNRGQGFLRRKAAIQSPAKSGAKPKKGAQGQEKKVGGSA